VAFEAGGMSAAEVILLAQNIARNRGWPVFPCGLETKAPTGSKADGGNGFKDATVDPGEIAWLWRNWPGCLIGIPTGAVSGIDVLDVDAKHEMATRWWAAASKRSPPTRTYRTRGGGHHCYFQHSGGISNTQSKLAHGVDSRGDGGYIVHWFSAGFECLDHAPIAPWPTWLRDCLLWQPPKVERRPYVSSAKHADKAIEDVLRHVATAREGERNAILFWGACRLRERTEAGQIGQGEATALLVNAARSIGLQDLEAKRTVSSAWRRA
jgi:Bifunctional DNA primase/polymerase, N-terminal